MIIFGGRSFVTTLSCYTLWLVYLTRSAWLGGNVWADVKPSPLALSSSKLNFALHLITLFLPEDTRLSGVPCHPSLLPLTSSSSSWTKYTLYINTDWINKTSNTPGGKHTLVPLPQKFDSYLSLDFLRKMNIFNVDGHRLKIGFSLKFEYRAMASWFFPTTDWSTLIAHFIFKICLVCLPK